MLMHLLPEYDPLKCCTWMCGGWKPGSWAPAAQLPPGCCIVELTVAPVTKAEDCIGQSLKQPGPGDIFSDRSFLFHLFSSANICQYQLGRTVIQHDFTLIQWHKRYDAICDIIQAYFATLTTSRYDPIWSDNMDIRPLPFSSPRHVFGSVAGSISCHRRRMFSGGSPANQVSPTPHGSSWFPRLGQW
jgi:hypothetical protein